MNNSKAIFDQTAATYDSDRSRLIPCHDTFYRWALDLIPPDSRRMADFGAGSGHFTALLRDRFPDAEIHLIDFSGPMLDLARRRLGEGPLLIYHEADYTTDPLPGDLDAAVSSLSIHHLEDDRKQALLARIHATLRPGGVFVNADQVLGPTPELDARYSSIWLAQARANGATEEQISSALFRMREDRCAPLEAQLGWMRQAGFLDVDCWFKDNRFAVMSGRKD